MLLSPDGAIFDAANAKLLSPVVCYHSQRNAQCRSSGHSAEYPTAHVQVNHHMYSVIADL